ncbi:hypothetical protein FRX31_034154 [Thalictrum thalictroides]|uniref:Uncharacterized protein n=1 Tax=Thalictrum thalictroides TaxID=46969 RepID=A0A7J6UUV7_THATH|nr:hypothetical protein FRX31_034154 [Thalictrum thalictroides]
MASKCVTISIAQHITILLIIVTFCNADDVLLCGENLYSGNSLEYNNCLNNATRLQYILVLYDIYSDYPIWATNTGGLAS